ncbi:response regulator [Deinococcus alpinitundrae]|uniref:response regulator n=1 Tax=Deinococcus alpinitundrae TaxID=468913 RepID=UPI00137ABC56|nr:response regulator transcription factor [Deinococcus alpinitundrae]
MNAAPLRVGLVDDQTLVREGLCRLLDYAPDVAVVLEAGDGGEALELIRHTPLDVLLLDVRMPTLDGIGVLSALKAEDRLPPTLMLTTFNDDVALWQSLRAGARGFILKDVTFAQLLTDVREVARGGTVIRALSQVHPLRSGEAAMPVPSDLTERERELLQLMVGGYSNRELADLTGLKEGTVKNYLSSILIKLGARDRTRAVLLALELRLI